MHYPINHTAFKITKGITTEILFFIKNIDNVPVTTLVGTPKIIINTQNNEIEILQKDFELVNAEKSLWKIVFTPQEMESIPLGGYIYFVVVNNAGVETFLYTDKAYGATGTLEAVTGPYAAPQGPVIVQRRDMLWDNGIVVSGSYKSAENPYQTGNHVINTSITEFTGNIYVEASTFDQPSQNHVDWEKVHTVEVTEATSNAIEISLPSAGYKWLRFSAKEKTGNVVTFSYSRYME